MVCKNCKVETSGLNQYCSARCRILYNVVVENDCWIWQLSFSTGGYPLIRIEDKSYRGNRISYEAFNGPISEALVVRHTCHNRACLNPAHLIVGTQKDNVLDALAHGSHRTTGRGSRHHGAKLTEEQVLKIRADSRPHKVVAKEYGVYWNTIYRIRARFDWKHI